MARPVIYNSNGVPMRRDARLGFTYGGPHGFEGGKSDRQQTQSWSTFAVPATGETAGGRGPLAARARDLIRNNGKAEGARAKQVDRVIGGGLRFRSRPNAAVLGVDPLEALQFGRQIERELNLWASKGWRPQCDVQRKRSWGELQRILFSDRMVAGETLIILRAPEERGTRYRTCIQIVDPERLSNPHDKPDTELLRQGIEYDEDSGEPVAYHIRDQHPNDPIAIGDLFSWTRVPRFDEEGRPVCVHGYSQTRSEQDRGISAFASILLAFRDVQRFSEAELGAAIINALLTAFIKSNFDPMAVAESLGLDDFNLSGATSSWQDARLAMMPENYKILDNQLIMLPPGDEIETNNTQRETAGFESFVKAMDRGMAAALGMDYPSFAADLEGVNYSSYRGGLLDAWRAVTGSREEFAADTAFPVVYGVITEAFERGYLVEPGDDWPPFEEMPEAYLAGVFLGPGRGTVDPVKEAQGKAIEIANGFTSHSAVAEDQGLDFEEILDQRATDEMMARERGVTLTTVETAAAATEPDEEDEGSEPDEDEDPENETKLDE